MANEGKMEVKTDKKELIMVAAGEVFGERGFHATTVEAIAQQAGVGKGTIYQYFTSKVEIFKELHHWYLDRYFDGFERSIDPKDSFEVNLKRLITAHVDNVELMAGVFRKILPESAEIPMTKDDSCEMRNYVNARMASLGDLLEASVATGELRAVQKDIVLHFIMGMLSGTMHSLVSSGPIGDEERDYLKSELLEIIMRGIVNRS